MKTISTIWIVAVFLCTPAAVFAQAAPQQPHAKRASETASSFAFEPLDNWKSAVLAGDKAALLMMTRSDHMISRELPADWNGVFVYNIKPA